ncbi:juvenile hormone acid O-methyltransferase [Halyomorpha halys]|uniref:juvenile hormone acid O-methyltransferase n=1 Tax=Halyomorpha halys TaxID=286706 RepID=UPI0006D4EFAA|nr:juvenile hormone acid O-methyltransferase [Halyomorpha halys]
MQDPQASINWSYMQKKDVVEILEEFKHQMEWNDGEQILDIGCGLADVTISVIYPMLPPRSVLVGIDVCDDMIDFCKKFKMRDRVRYHLLDIQQPELTTEWDYETFDKIFSFSCLHWVKDYSQAMSNIYNLLKLNGDVLLLFLTPDNPVHLAFQQLNLSPRWRTFFRDVTWFYATDDPISFIQTKLRVVGFQAIRCFPKVRHSDYHSWEAFMELVRAVNPYTRVLPEELQQHCLNDVSEVLKQQRHVFQNPDTGAVMMEYNVIVAMAKKT